MTRVYVYVYRGILSGGPEAIHQLVHELTAQGVEAYLVATPETREWPVAREYDGYGCRYAAEVPDEESSVVVVPEVAISLLGSYRRARPVVWWLSVDHGEPYASEVGWRTRRRLGRLIRSARNLAQSAYARDEIARRQGVRLEMLSDYITSTPGDPVPRAPRSVAYNAARGKEPTRRVRERLPDLDWRPIKDLSRDKVDELLRSTVVYLDLGEHPGKDRIPREAAAAGCVVVVGRTGSAVNDEDVPIPGTYKVDWTEAVALLEEVLADPAPHVLAQRDHVERIGREREVFRQEVASFVAGLNGSPS